MLPCVILAGGQSRRMGRDKANLPVADETLLAQQYRKMRLLFADVYVSCKTSQVLDGGDYRLLREMAPESSPIYGLIHALERLRSDQVFVIPVDTPLVEPESIKALIDMSNSGDADVFLMQDANRIHPLIGIYTRSALPVLQKAVTKRDYRLMNLLDQLSHRLLFCDDVMQFINLNTPETYRTYLEKRDVWGW